MRNKLLFPCTLVLSAWLHVAIFYFLSHTAAEVVPTAMPHTVQPESFRLLRCSLDEPDWGKQTDVKVSKQSAAIHGYLTSELDDELVRQGPLERIELDSLGGLVSVSERLPRLAKQVVLRHRVASAAAMIATNAANACVDATTVSSLHFHAIHEVTCTHDGRRVSKPDTVSTNEYVAGLRSPLKEYLHNLSEVLDIAVPIELFFKAYPDKRCG